MHASTLTEPTTDLIETEDQEQISQNSSSECTGHGPLQEEAAWRHLAMAWGWDHLWWPSQVIEVNSVRFAVCIKVGEGDAIPPKSTSA